MKFCLVLLISLFWLFITDAVPSYYYDDVPTPVYKVSSDTVVATEDEGGGEKQCDCSQQFKKVFKLLSDVQSDITAGQGRQRKTDQRISTLSTAMSSVHSKQKLHTNQLDQISSDVSTVNSAHEDMSSRMTTLESKSSSFGPQLSGVTEDVLEVQETIRSHASQLSNFHLVIGGIGNTMGGINATMMKQGLRIAHTDTKLKWCSVKMSKILMELQQCRQNVKMFNVFTEETRVQIVAMSGWLSLLTKALELLDDKISTNERNDDELKKTVASNQEAGEELKASVKSLKSDLSSTMTNQQQMTQGFQTLKDSVLHSQDYMLAVNASVAYNYMMIMGVSNATKDLMMSFANLSNPDRHAAVNDSMARLDSTLNVTRPVASPYYHPPSLLINGGNDIACPDGRICSIYHHFEASCTRYIDCPMWPCNTNPPCRHSYSEDDPLCPAFHCRKPEPPPSPDVPMHYMAAIVGSSVAVGMVIVGGFWLVCSLRSRAARQRSSSSTQSTQQDDPEIMGGVHGVQEEEENVSMSSIITTEEGHRMAASILGSATGLTGLTNPAYSSRDPLTEAHSSRSAPVTNHDFSSRSSPMVSFQDVSHSLAHGHGGTRKSSRLMKQPSAPNDLTDDDYV